ncbi:MAG: VWA domain-containing protein [Thermoanaerobaculia bacterium]|nr:VWA domain-containing protein [Thermoanaerobaculia bacterium]
MQTRRIALPLAFAAQLFAAALAGQPEPPPRVIGRALGLFDGGPEGDLAVTALLAPDEESGTATVEVTLPGAAAGARAWVVVPRLDGEPLVVTLAPPPAPDATAGRRLRATFALPDDFLEAAVVVEADNGRRWGAALAELTDELAPAPDDLPVWTAPLPAAAGQAGAAGGPEAVVIRILPPRESQVTGRVRFRTLVSDPQVIETVFELDGQRVATDDDPPFTAQIDLGPRPLPRRLTVVAYGPEGAVLGRDTIRLNVGGAAFAVRIARVVGDPGAGPVKVEARVDLPAEGELESVGFYRNQELVELVREPPFAATLELPEPGPADFLRVVARLADGREAEDARLLVAPAERVEVNLVEIYAVVTGADGQPVADLTAGDLRVELAGRPVALERFGPADRVPLVLGLIIDTSGSMEPLMIDTKQAGSKFLVSVLREELGDRAFLVDFDTRPRLAHSTTAEVGDLLRSFGRLRADGFTALYDAVIFSLLQFEAAGGRRALVLLTDGDDYKSRFGQGRAIGYARELGVPVYILGLGGLLDARHGLRKIDLEGITESTGGRIFYIGSTDELDAAYAAIQRELRNQYLLAFSTDRELTRRELETLRVSAVRRGLAVRAVVGGRVID